ncbi:hypothetical protein NW752_002295 [Fusarium irregulare]|uniref:DUF7136 domain-containing protein n=1 Tax=Fusarium irregulare TaxID=2494466 RepID=A0A9W8PFR4_9HYPO|nr:hypothetical protein NW766_011010 [Fusarium irregulare]KAJ4024843.1 hypothetical protein NW752_002295 [Fusarium irregulare]
MRFTPLSIFSLACWSFLHSGGAAKEETGPTGALQIDLVFPRNETYSPSPIMPIVFSFRNTELLPFLRPTISYEVWNYDNFSADAARGDIEVPSVNETTVNPHIEFKWHLHHFNTEGTWKASFHIRWIHCYVSPADQGRGELDMLDVNETDIGVIFTTKGTSKEIDLVEATSKNCSSPVGTTIKVTDSMRTPFSSSAYDQDVCPVVASPPIEADSCDVTLDATVASSIDAAMTSWVCNEFWETARPQEVNCSSQKEEESTALRSVAGGVTYLAFILGVLVLI